MQIFIGFFMFRYFVFVMISLQAAILQADVSYWDAELVRAYIHSSELQRKWAWTFMAPYLKTFYIFSHANTETLRDEEQRHLLSHYLRLYIRMFRPHEAREDTVLFPAFRRLLSHEEYEKLGDQFEEREHQLFGEDGFEKTVNQVAEIEKQLGIYNLSQFTPHLNLQ